MKFWKTQPTMIVDPPSAPISMAAITRTRSREALEILDFRGKFGDPFRRESLARKLNWSRAPTPVPIESLINSGKPLEAWEAIQGLPPRLKFTTQTMRQRLRCATLLGWTRRVEMLQEVISTAPEAVFAFPDDNSSSVRGTKEAFSRDTALGGTILSKELVAH